MRNCLLFSTENQIGTSVLNQSVILTAAYGFAMRFFREEIIKCDFLSQVTIKNHMKNNMFWGPRCVGLNQTVYIFNCYHSI